MSEFINSVTSSLFGGSESVSKSPQFAVGESQEKRHKILGTQIKELCASPKNKALARACRLNDLWSDPKSKIFSQNAELIDNVNKYSQQVLNTALLRWYVDFASPTKIAQLKIDSNNQNSPKICDKCDVPRNAQLWNTWHADRDLFLSGLRETLNGSKSGIDIQEIAKPNLNYGFDTIAHTSESDSIAPPSSWWMRVMLMLDMCTTNCYKQNLVKPSNPNDPNSNITEEQLKNNQLANESARRVIREAFKRSQQIDQLYGGYKYLEMWKDTESRLKLKNEDLMKLDEKAWQLSTLSNPNRIEKDGNEQDNKYLENLRSSSDLKQIKGESSQTENKIQQEIVSKLRLKGINQLDLQDDKNSNLNFKLKNITQWGLDVLSSKAWRKRFASNAHDSESPPKSESSQYRIRTGVISKKYSQNSGAENKQPELDTRMIKDVSETTNFGTNVFPVNGVNLNNVSSKSDNLELDFDIPAYWSLRHCYRTSSKIESQSDQAAMINLKSGDAFKHSSISNFNNNNNAQQQNQQGNGITDPNVTLGYMCGGGDTWEEIDPDFNREHLCKPECVKGLENGISYLEQVLNDGQPTNLDTNSNRTKESDPYKSTSDSDIQTFYNTHFVTTFHSNVQKFNDAYENKMQQFVDTLINFPGMKDSTKSGIKLNDYKKRLLLKKFAYEGFDGKGWEKNTRYGVIESWDPKRNQIMREGTEDERAKEEIMSTQSLIGATNQFLRLQALEFQEKTLKSRLSRCQNFQKWHKQVCHSNYDPRARINQAASKWMEQDRKNLNEISKGNSNNVNAESNASLFDIAKMDQWSLNVDQSLDNHMKAVENQKATVEIDKLGEIMNQIINSGKSPDSPEYNQKVKELFSISIQDKNINDNLDLVTWKEPQLSQQFPSIFRTTCTVYDKNPELGNEQKATIIDPQLIMQKWFYYTQGWRLWYTLTSTDNLTVQDPGNKNLAETTLACHGPNQAQKRMEFLLSRWQPQVLAPKLSAKDNNIITQSEPNTPLAAWPLLLKLIASNTKFFCNQSTLNTMSASELGQNKDSSYDQIKKKLKPQGFPYSRFNRVHANRILSQKTLSESVSTNSEYREKMLKSASQAIGIQQQDFNDIKNPFNLVPCFAESADPQNVKSFYDNTSNAKLQYQTCLDGSELKNESGTLINWGQRVPQACQVTLGKGIAKLDELRNKSLTDPGKQGQVSTLISQCKFLQEFFQKLSTEFDPNERETHPAATKSSDPNNNKLKAAPNLHRTFKIPPNLLPMPNLISIERVTADSGSIDGEDIGGDSMGDTLVGKVDWSRNKLSAKLVRNSGQLIAKVDGGRKGKLLGGRFYPGLVREEGML